MSKPSTELRTRGAMVLVGLIGISTTLWWKDATLVPGVVGIVLVCMAVGLFKDRSSDGK